MMTSPNPTPAAARPSLQGRAPREAREAGAPAAVPSLAAPSFAVALATLRRRLAHWDGSSAQRSVHLREALAGFASGLPLQALREYLPAASAQGYQRKVLCADPHGRYCAVAIIWAPGQFSPVHAHHTWCAYAVLDGTLTETQYRWCGERGAARPARTLAHAPGTVSYTEAGRAGIHCLGNAAGNGAAAISLHIYGVDELHIASAVNDLLPVATD